MCRVIAPAVSEEVLVIPVLLPLLTPGGVEALPSLVLEWRVDRSLRACTPSRDFRRSVAEELGRDPFVDDASDAVGTLLVEARRVRGRARVMVLYAPPGQASPLRLSPGDVAPSECGELLGRLAGELRDVLAPRAPVAPPQQRDPAPEAPLPVTAPLRAVITTTRVEARGGLEGYRATHEVRHEAELDAVIPPPPPPSDDARWSGRLSVLAGAALNGQPTGFAPSISVSLLVHRARLGFATNVTAELPLDQDVSCHGVNVGTLSSQRVQVDAGPCLALRDVSLCAGGVARIIHARADALDASEPAYGRQFGGFLRVDGRVAISRSVSAVARVEASVASGWTFNATDQIRGGECAVASTGFFSAGASVGLSFGLW